MKVLQKGFEEAISQVLKRHLLILHVPTKRRIVHHRQRVLMSSFPEFLPLHLAEMALLAASNETLLVHARAAWRDAAFPAKVELARRGGRLVTFDAFLLHLST